MPNDRAPKRGPWDADIFTVAQGPLECARLVRQGWEVFDKDLLLHEIRPARPGQRRVVQVVAYWWLGRKRPEDETELEEVERQAQEAADDVAAATPQPEPPDDVADAPAADVKPQPADPPPLPGSRKPRRGRAKAPGAVGAVETEGIRGGQLRR